MKYALLVHQSQEHFDNRNNAAAMAAGRAYGEALQTAGVFVGGAGLESPQAVAGAEDALGDAFVAALERWPVDGVPQKPEAWLLHVARNRLIDAVRRNQVRQKSEMFLRQIAEEAQTVAAKYDHFPDERLKLLFVCAHPAIDAAARTPLMLQTVLGVDSARIASAFLVSPAAMAQRLVRAKNKIRDAAIPFRVPDPSEWNERVSFVLDAIYSGYTAGWESLNEVGSTLHALAADAGIGSLVGRAVALAQAGKLAAGFSALEEIPVGRIVSYQPYWAARGHCWNC